MSMFIRNRRLASVAVVTTLGLIYLWTWGGFDAVSFTFGPSKRPSWPVAPEKWRKPADDSYLWRTVVTNYPIPTFRPLPTSQPKSFPKIQATFPPELDSQRQLRQERQQAVKSTFLKSWTAYKNHAWMADELEPVSGGRRNPFGGWAASLVDALDTLWIMDLRDEFYHAVDAVGDIDFTHTDLGQLNIFETTIRYLGGFLSAYELSNDERLLRKAAEVGELIYKAFDTPNHMPATRWDFHAAIKGEKQVAGTGTLAAEIGSLSMELTRLSQITGDTKWFDAVHRITEHLAAQQDSTDIPGLWPLAFNAKEMVFDRGSTFTLGAMADSLYEYLPKMAALTGGQLPVYQTMYQKAMDVAPKYNFFRPMTPNNEDILISGQAHVKKEDGKSRVEVEYQGQHLVCFIGGMLAVGGKLFSRPQDIELATKLTDGCVYAYKAFPHGIMPESMYMAPCNPDTDCSWDERRWKEHVLKANDKGADATMADAEAIVRNEHLPKGFTRVNDRRYLLRPEAIESVLVLYRVTGRQDLVESAWDMFTAIEKATRTELANTAVSDVANPEGSPGQFSSMESFWMGETLKYFYLIFSDPELISLDEYVFNTEAHPFRRL
ncbi:hypothetical protein ACO1O0_006938 [Amphichorda felina]